MITTENCSVNKPLEGTGLLTGRYYDPYPARFSANVKELLAKGHPMVLRLHAGVRYDMPDEHLFESTDLEGHVTVLAGFDDERGVFQFADPWPTEMSEGRTVEEIEEEGAGVIPVNASQDFACTGIPLPINIEMLPAGHEYVRVQATVSLRLPNALTCAVTDMEALRVRLELPAGLVNEEESADRCIDSLASGEGVIVEWIVRVTDDFDAGDIRVAAAGIGHGIDPYQWSDVIGGQARLAVRASAKTPTAEQMTEA